MFICIALSSPAVLLTDPQPLPVTHPHSLSERQNGTNAMDESVLVTLARVAERAERYDEMADFMKQRVGDPGSWSSAEESCAKMCKGVGNHKDYDIKSTFRLTV